MSRLLVAACVAIIAASVLSAGTPSQSLRERAKYHAEKYPGEPMMMLGPVGDYPAKTIAQLTREADVVFHGRAYLLKSYAWKDGERILSDYEIRDQQLLAGRTAAAVARARDTSKPLVLTAMGGELTIEGVRVIATPSAERRVEDGGEYILFLMPSRGGGDRYEPYGAGVFEVRDGRTKPLHAQGETLFRDAFDAPLETVLARIQDARLF